MKPFFFGSSERQLFGSYHAPIAETREVAVVLCYPWVAEYNMTHFAFRRLANSLAREGFPTLRFDYFGTGDSMGNSDAADLRTWPDDIVTAGTELLERSGLQRLTLIGKGLGATLALQASERLPIKDIALWDPVISGGDTLTEYDVIDARQRHLRLLPPAPPPGSRAELCGFAVPLDQRTALASINLTRLTPRLSGTISLVASYPSEAFRRAVTQWSAAGLRARLVDAEEGLDEAAATGQTALLSSKPVTALVSGLLEATQP
jgi:uncharacterized protein